ncbi:hypothetical protein LAZ67_14002175 [Cordylochernes scorpioides]|uniref:CCHC-type domain-containing protein n=1 Tax=Cordylochernes scorpioides TaxID=51811 RepID=A0ABY6L999_9ARAC|nr:hypothetical protein LAZ67_14002175 [Cordylochernes scorpioides]
MAHAIEHLPRGKAPGWDGLPCELLVAFNEDFFAKALARVFAASRLRGAPPPSTRRSSICLVPKARGGRGLDGYRPVALPYTDYRVLAAILHRRLKPHLRTLVPECQTYAVPGRSPSWNIAMVTDAVEEATALGSPLAVMGVDLESAFDSLDRGFLESLLTSLRLPPAFRAWINILYAGADATIRAGGFYTTAFPLLNGLRQGCAHRHGAAATSPGVNPRRGQCHRLRRRHRPPIPSRRVATVFEEYKQASGVGVNLRKSAGLWCGAWRNRSDSPLGASWSTTSIRILGLDIAPRSTVAHREQHLLALLETACRRWTPFTRGLSLVGRARAANTLVGTTIQHHLHGYLPSPPTIAKLQARLARFVWGPDHTAWLPANIMARPVTIGGLGLHDLATQLQLACLKGVQVALRGGINAFSWLVESGEAWIHPPPDGTRLQPRRLRLLKLWEEASNILSLNHRALPTAQLLDLPIIGGCRFLRPPDLLAAARWSGARVRDLIEEEHLIARPTRSVLADATALGAFCRRLTSENAVGFGAESTPSSSSLAAAVVLRGRATPFLNGLTTRSARRALDRPRLAATPISRFLARWTPTINPPSRIDWASLRRCAYSGHEADAALKLALHALPHPAHPASVGPSCPACGSIDRFLGHRYWCCRSIRPLIREAFNIIGRPPDLQAWIFGGSGLEDDALSILASAKLRIYRYFVQVGLGEAVEDPLIAWSRTLQRRGLLPFPSKAEEKPARHGMQAQPCAELTAKQDLQKNFSISSSEDQRYANPPTGVGNANLAAARGDVTTGSVAATSSNGAARVLGNWADYTEDQRPGEDDDFTVVRNKRRRRDSPGSPTAAKHHSNPRGAGANSRPRSSTGWVPRAEEIKTTRAHIAEARARQASSAEDNCVYVEYIPELEPYHYIRAVDRMIGGTNNVFQVSKINGHYLMGLNNRSLAERLISEGLEVEGTLFRAFPFRKRAMKITVGNLPFFVEDFTIISALTPYGRVTSIAPKLMKAGPYIYNDGRRDAFIVLHEGVTTERLPTRLEIKIKGEVWPAYLSYGIRCSRCHGQGHRRANCPLLAGRSNAPRPATPTSPTGVPPVTTPRPPQPPSAQPPPPASPSPAMEVSEVPSTSRAALHPPAAPRQSPPVAPAIPTEMAPPAPPPVTPAPSLRSPGSHGPAVPTLDVEMSIEETSTSSTSSSGTSTREGLVTFLERNPGVSFAQTDALGLGREEVLDLLSSKTKARKRGPLLSPSQGDALDGLIRQLLGLKPGGNSNIYKVLGQVRAALKTSPAAVPPTPPLPAPQPAGPIPPAPDEEEMTPIMREECMVIEIFKKLKHLTCLRPLYQSGIQPNDLKDAILFIDERESLMARLTPAMRGVLAEFLSAAIEPARGNHPDAQHWISTRRGVIAEKRNHREFFSRIFYGILNTCKPAHGTLAAARGDVTAPPTAASSSENLADPASLNWADSEMAEVDANDDYTVVKSKKRRLSSTPEQAAKQASRPAEKRGSQQQKRTTGPRSMPPQEIKATRANIADARARQANTNHENYVFVELCPDIPDYSYLRAIGDLVGGPKNIAHFGRMNGHYIVGLASKNLASRLVEEGLNIEGTLIKVFPFRKRAERIIVANLPGFVEDATIVQALREYGDITSIAPIMIKMGKFAFSDGRREAFILLREGVRLETLPTRLTIHSKGDTLSAFLSFGIKCSKCGKQGHRRANCPALARQGNGSPRQAASPTDARPPLPPPQRPRKPAPAPATPASPVQPAKTSAEAQAIPSAHQPAEQIDLTHPAPAAHPAPLAALRPPEPRIPPLDQEMSVEKLSSPPATPARGKAALEQLLEHLGKSPNPSIDWDKLPDLNCEEAQKLLTSETTMKRRAPTLTEEQFTALEKLHETIKALCPDSNSTIRKTLQKTRKETNAFHPGSGQDLCLGYSAVVLAHPVAISGSGLACVFGPGVAVLQQRILWPGHIALATIDVHGEEMTAIAVHLAHEPRERNRQLELLAATAAQEEEGACWIIGDFNIRDRGPSSSSSSDVLAALLDLAALVDVATQFDAAHLPTRVSMHGDQVESNRLDRILVPAGVLDRVSIYATSHYHLSDHRLVLLQVGPPTTAVSSPTQPRLAAMLRSGLALEHLAGYIRELEEDTAHDDDDGTFWDRWTSIKAGLLAEARSLHDPRHAANDSYVYRARRYIAAQLEASSIRADYPSLPDLARAIRLRRPVSVIRDEQDNIIEGPELRRRAFATFQPRFARPTSDPAAGAAFIASSAPTTTRELSEEDPLHRPDISPSEIANAIEHLPRGKAPGWDGLPCELLVAFSEDFFAEALARVFAASRLRGALPPSTRRSSICLVPKARGGRGLDGYRPVALPSADYRVLAAILHRRLKPHLRTLVPECQTYAVPGRSPSWNIAMVTDAIEEATALGSPLAVMGVDLESAFDSLDRGFLESLLTSLRLPPAFMAWINILYAGADATIRVGGFHTTAFPLLNGLRQGCAVSAALFSIATGPLLRRLELTLGVGNVIAYADDIVLLFHRDGDFERVATVFEDYRQASGIGVNLGKSAGLWCGAWRNRGDSPLGASWSTTSIRVLGLDIAPRSTVIHREQHLLALLETACRKWTPFTRGLSLVGRARAANTLVGSVIQHHLHGYLPSPPTIAKLQARLARFVWGQDHTAWLPADVMARPVAIGGLGLLDLATQLQLACLKGVQKCLQLAGRRQQRGSLDPPSTGRYPSPAPPSPLWEEASNILGLNHRAVPTAQLLDLPIIGGCRFLRPPDLLAPARWRGARVRDLIVEENLIARPTRSALADAATLGAFCRRLTSENAVGFGAESTPSSSSLAAAVVLRGTATPFLNGLTTRSARRALDRPRLAATPISRFLARWTPTINPPSRIDWASLRRCAYSDHEADAALKLALHALPHPAYPASVGPSCPACGSIDRSLSHRYWCCPSIRPLIREAFNIIGRPPDLQAWIFGGSGLEDDALSILASAKLRIYRCFVQVGLGEAVEDPLIAWSRTLQRRGLLPLSLL